MYSERIDRFLKNQMSQEESDAFLQELDNNKELREQAQLMALMIQDLQERQAKHDADIIAEVNAQKKKGRIIRWIGSVAAMLVIIFGASHMFRMNQIDNTFNEYYSSYDNPSNARGGEREEDHKSLDELIELYNKVGTEKDITPVIERLQVIYDNIQSRNDEYTNYRYYENDIAWYLALAYIKDHNLDKAKQMLKPLVDNGNEEAKELLDKIE